MGRRAITTPNITKDYDNRTTNTSIALPANYFDYLKKVVPFTEFTSFSELIKVAVSEAYPSPENFESEKAQLAKIAEAYINNKPIKKIKIRSENLQLIHKAK